MAVGDGYPVGVGSAVVAPILDREYIPKPEPPRPEDARLPRKLAIIVNHGMGQQVPFETLELVAQALWKKELEAGHRAEAVVTRMVRLGTGGKPEELELARAEVRLTQADGTPVEAHLYEAYWAPLTAGKVNLRQVIGFLLDAGWNGIRVSMGGSFRRWMFDTWQDIKIRRPQLVFSFLAAILTVLSLVVVNAMIAAAAASHTLGGSSSWPPAKQLGVLTLDLFLVDLCALSIFVGTILLPRLARKLRRLRKPLHYVAWAFVLVGIAGILVMGVVVSLHLLFKSTGIVPGPFLNRWSVLILWTLAVVGSALARNIIVEYAGDVTAYIAFHTVSVFLEVRKAIFELATNVARAVYRARTDDGRDFLYQDVIVVGHSLGSVIAYDVLNGLFIEEGFSSQPLDVAGRTALFLTFGSPLDKTAFVFRTQQDANSRLREAEATTVQPMIQAGYHFRPRHWKNIWSHSDWISGSLEYYDDWVGMTGGDRRVKNYRDPEATAPLVAHTQYWQNDLFANLLYAAATERPQPQPKELTPWQKRRAWLFAQPVDPLKSAYRPR